MNTLLTLLLLAAFPTAFGQYGDPGPAATPTTTSSTSRQSAVPGVQIVNVGQNGLSFTPNTITAAVGSAVEFHFFPPTHSVAQSSFAEPCVPSSNNTGFWSGLIQASGGESSNVFRITINDTNPIWFYCAVPSHCQGGMTGVINQPTDPNQSLSKYNAAATKVANSVEPPTVQGGIIGPAASATTSGGGAASSSGAVPSGAESSWNPIVRMGVAVGTLSLAVGLLMA